MKGSLFAIGLMTLCVLSLVSCTPQHLSERGPYLRSYHAGDFNQTVQRLNRLAEDQMPHHHYQESNDAAWILLDKATTHFAANQVDKAIMNYDQAVQSLDFYHQKILSEDFLKTLTSDNKGAYQADDFEQILARLYFALALLHENDEGNAFALLRQAQTFEEEKRSMYSRSPFERNYQLPSVKLHKYLFALLLEKRKDFSNAEILYQQSGLDLPSSNAPKTGNTATILVICHNGNIPYKVSVTSPASVASAIALEIMMSGRKIDPAWSSFCGIPIPEYRYWPQSFPFQVISSVDGAEQALVPAVNLATLAEEELSQKTPVIAARGVARLLSRRAVVAHFQKQDSTMGFLADMTMLAINDQTKADTRSWTTLPQSIDLSRYDVAPGKHQLTLQVSEKPRSFPSQYSLKLGSNDLCIIHVFNIHPGVRQVLIPSRYISQEGE